MDTREHARLERLELVELLEGLSPDQWEAPTLCERWRVRDVVAHVLAYEDLGPRDVGTVLVRGRLRFDRMNDLALERFRHATPADLLERARTHTVPSGLTAMMGAGIALTDGMVHQQDVRRPLGLPRRIDPDRLRFVLRFAATSPALLGLWQTRGVRVVAEDVDWATGRGPEARGTGEQVLMVMAGRRGIARELTGPGAERLVRRTG